MSRLRTSLGAVFHAEVLFNAKRVAPYALMLLFSANAVLWWGWGPAVAWGWATNGDFYIIRLFVQFSFMTLPLFVAVIMADPVVRDFNLGVEPLIFSKPVSRLEYLAGKFLGNFFVLVCCMACYALTLFLLQAVSRPNMIVLPVRVGPYVKHFFFVVVVSSLALSVLCFTVGTLTRSVKLVYGLMTSFYVLFIAWQYAIRGLPPRWRIVLDPLLFNVVAGVSRASSAGWVNQFQMSYNADMLANRALLLLASAACFALLYACFSTTGRARRDKSAPQLTTLSLGTSVERLDTGTVSLASAPAELAERAAPAKLVALPRVSTTTAGAWAGLRQLQAATEVELRLLAAERSLVVLLPLTALLSVFGLTYYKVAPDPSYSAAYAGRTADSLLLFLAAIAVFYTGEALHRDRELRVEPVLWSVPAPNFVLLLSKFAATLLVALAACALVGATALALQSYNADRPIETLTYLVIYAAVLLPSVVFMIAAATLLNVLLRDKHLAYAACLALGGGLFYLYSLGHNHPLYNPLLYGLWRPADFVRAGPRLAHILVHRAYCLALAALCLALAHLFFERKLAGDFSAVGRLRGKGRIILAAAAAATAAVITGLLTVGVFYAPPAR